MKKRGDGRYCKQIFLGYNSDGSRKFKTIYGKTIKEIESKEVEIKSQLKHDTYIENDKITVDIWAKEWFETYKSNLEYNTMFMYQNSIEKHIIPMIGNILLSQIKTIQLQKMLNEIVAQGKTRTAEICRLTIKQIMECAYQEKLINRDITIGLKPIKKEQKEQRVLSDEEISVIEEAPLSTKERLFVDIARYTGLRKGEILALTIADIDFKNHKISVNKSLYYKGNKPEIKSPKSKSGYRNVPIPDKLLITLKKHIKENSSLIIFTMSGGGYMSKQSFRGFWDKIIKKINENIENENKGTLKFYKDDIKLTPHIFRHTYATNLYYAGIDVKTAQYLMGHSSVDVTLKIYTHLDAKKTELTFEKINEYFAKC